MLTASAIDPGLIELCVSLHEIAQRHVPPGSFADVNELVQITKILEELAVPVQTAPKLQAKVADHSNAVVRHTPEYRLLRARYSAALGTIADMGSRKIRKNKDQFHAGIQEGLRRAAKIAIMFLEDLDNPTFEPRQKHAEPTDKAEAPKVKPGGSFIR